MARSFTDMVALAALMFWPAIPLFWIPVHCAPKFFRRAGFFTYALPIVTWLPAAFIIFQTRNAILSSWTAFPAGVRIIGALVFLLGAALQTWTLIELTAPVILGMPEVTKTIPGRIVASGPFGVIRHPTYVSHTLMLLGIFFWTGVTAVGVVTIVDALAVSGAIVPLEERELLKRFGSAYEDYRRQVPRRFIPPLGK